MGKLFAAARLSSPKRKHAHMAWDGSEFNLTRAIFKTHIKSHKKLRIDRKGSRVDSYGSKELNGVADTGCQTCTVGADIRRDLKCQSTYLVPTSHRVIEINASKL